MTRSYFTAVIVLSIVDYYSTIAIRSLMIKYSCISQAICYSKLTVAGTTLILRLIKRSTNASINLGKVTAATRIDLLPGTLSPSAFVIILSVIVTPFGDIIGRRLLRDLYCSNSHANEISIYDNTRTRFLTFNSIWRDVSNCTFSFLTVQWIVITFLCRSEPVFVTFETALKQRITD